MTTGATPVPASGHVVDEDYAALRHGVGAVDLPRDVVRLSGPDALEYLQGQCSQDVVALAIGESADALLLTPQGKLDALVRVTRAADDELYVDVDGGYGAAVAARLARFKLRVKADIDVVDWRCVALRGPGAADMADAALTLPGVSLVAPYRWGAVGGLDLFGVGPDIPAGVRRCGVGAWRSVRVESGIPVMGAELDERTIAAEAGLLERCVSFTKGCYTGQELVARLDARGNKVARRLRGLVMEHDPSAAGHGPPPGAEVASGDRVVGRVTSVAWSPALETVVALAYLHRDVEPPCPVQVRTPEAAADSILTAEARALPLVT
jgi:folate-binding protein YgfZ